MIELGVETLMVPSNLPIGCLPVYLEFYKTTSNESQFDPQNGCLKWLNQFSEYHNQQLQEQLKRIRVLHPHVHLIYVDYFNAAMRIYNAPKDFGMYLSFLFILKSGAGKQKDNFWVLNFTFM